MDRLRSGDGRTLQSRNAPFKNDGARSLLVQLSIGGDVMKRSWIEYREQWDRSSPMAFWVHLPTDGKEWLDATDFEPPGTLFGRRSG
ncbi:MAG: hypothetical protein JXB13_21745 [Phycisphaerae bacterium]|nr:hypothetical protein [Phycisphaerae bacterium]